MVKIKENLLCACIFVPTKLIILPVGSHVAIAAHLSLLSMPRWFVSDVPLQHTFQRHTIYEDIEVIMYFHVLLHRRKV